MVKPGEMPTLKTSNYGAYIINESGLYSLILSSKLETAKTFKYWVTSEVLPSIRKTGSYTARPMTDQQKATIDAQNRRISLEAAKLLNQIAADYEGDYRQILQAHATRQLTGEFVLPLPEIAEKTYSAAEIGEMLGVSANKIGRLANANEMKTEEFGKFFVDKSPYSNKEVETFRYFDGAIQRFRELLKTE